jgi:cytochrome c5
MANLSIRRLAVSLLVVALAPFAAQALPSGYEQDVRAYNLAHGRVVFSDKCMRCHETGKRGAPVWSSAEDWATRLQKPLSTLIKNAQEGHGDMPPKGDLELTDQDVAAAVAYVAHHGRRLLANNLDNLAATAAGDSDLPQGVDLANCSAGGTPAPCVVQAPANDAVFNMFLLLIRQERWR